MSDLSARAQDAARACEITVHVCDYALPFASDVSYFKIIVRSFNLFLDGVPPMSYFFIMISIMLFVSVEELRFGMNGPAQLDTTPVVCFAVIKGCGVKRLVAHFAQTYLHTNTVKSKHTYIQILTIEVLCGKER